MTTHGFIAANMAVTAYNMIVFIGIVGCAALRVRCPRLAYLFVPWLGVGAVIYVVTLFAVST